MEKLENDFLDKLKELLEQEGELLLDMELTEMEAWDSLSIVSFAAMANVEYEVELDSQQLENAKTIRDLYAMVK